MKNYTYKAPTRDNSGFGMIEVLISAAMSIGVILGATSLLTQQQQQQSRIEAKNEALETQMAVLASLSDSTICSANFSSSPLDLSEMDLVTPKSLPSPMSLASLKLTSDASSAASVTKGSPLPNSQMGPKVKDIYLDNIQRKSATDDTLYKGILYVSFDKDPRFKPDLLPIMIQVDFQTNSGPLNARTIQNCLGSTSGASAGAPIVPSTATIGSACSPPGGLGYDITKHVPALCDSTGVWKGMGLTSGNCGIGAFAKGFNSDGTPKCTTTKDAGAPCWNSSYGITLEYSPGKFCCMSPHFYFDTCSG